MKIGRRNQKRSRNNNWKGGRSLSSKGYVLTRKPDHPRASNGYVFEHILIAERMLGRALRYVGSGDAESEVVHHRNGDRQDNRPENLEVILSSTHTTDHNNARPGPAPRGESHGSSKLTDADVREIRSLHYSVSFTQLAARFAVCRSTIALILARRTWKHL